MQARFVTLVSPFKGDVLEVGEPVKTVMDGGVRYIWTYFQNGRRVSKDGYRQDFDGKISDVKVKTELSFTGLCQQASLVPYLKSEI
jgi:hypothetical protein